MPRKPKPIPLPKLMSMEPKERFDTILKALVSVNKDEIQPETPKKQPGRKRSDE